MPRWTYGDNTDISFFENVWEIPVYVGLSRQRVNPI